MKVVRTVADLRRDVAAARATGQAIGLVPTMGALHDGHASLMRRARERCGFTIVSLFVNPAQFDDPSDLDRYPRNETADAELARAAGVDVLFAPPVDEVYPPGFATVIEVGGVTERLEGASRGPGHFRGVATVVAKLLGMATPDVAFFGQKDAQQALVIQRLVRDLDIAVQVEVCPTVREPDGLAMSSRNVRLDEESRPRATAISRALFVIQSLVAGGERDVARTLEAAREVLAAAGITPEYLAAVSVESLQDVQRFDGRTLVAVAAQVGGVRLIDNVVVDVPPAA